MTDPQPAPTIPDHLSREPVIGRLVIEDMTTRMERGFEKYGTYLRPHNGRSALIDAYQEALDLAVYLRQAIYERHGR